MGRSLHSENDEAGKSNGEPKLEEKERILLLQIASRVKQIRQRAGVSQEKFYLDTSIHIGRIETGKLNISINTLFRICGYFNISVKEFFMGIKK